VGQKVAITSSRPQTTRHAIRGIVHRDGGQLIIVDTPGLHRPRTLLGQRLNDVVRATWTDVDVIGICIPANEDVGPGDRFIAGEIASINRTPKIAIVTKADLVGKDRLARQLVAVAELDEEFDFGWTQIVPVSAQTNDQVDLLVSLLFEQLPPGPAFYPEGELTDEPEETMIAELVREAALEGVRDELPHSIAVVVDEIIPRDGRPPGKPLVDIHVNLYVERESQKAIVIGRRGARLRDVGTKARTQIERLLGSPVFLDLHVKVAKDWQRDPKQLGRLGF
jgi:GTP-binding protein Era